MRYFTLAEMQDEMLSYEQQVRQLRRLLARAVKGYRDVGIGALSDEECSIIRAYDRLKKRSSK